MLLLVARAFAAEYDLDSAASALYVQVFKDPATIASRLAHDHVVAASGWRGWVRWGGADGCAGEVRVPVDQLVVDAPEWRQRAGLTKPPSASDREKVRASMLDEGQLHAAAHPWITFEATACDAASVTGRLTLRGVAKTVTIPMHVSAEGGGIHATGSFTVRATDFGFEPYSAFLGAVRNRDEMRIVVDVVGRVRAPS